MSANKLNEDRFKDLYHFLLRQSISLAPYPGRFDTGVTRLHVSRLDVSSNLVSFVIKPAVLFFLDGFCQSDLGLYNLTVRPGNYVVLGSQMPTLANVTVPPKRTFLLLMLILDLPLLRGLVSSTPPAPCHHENAYPSGMAVGAVDERMIQILIELAGLAASPADEQLRSPEILMRLYEHILAAPQGAVLRRASYSLHADIARSINWLDEMFNEDIEVGDLARVADMPLTSFYRHFKSVTSLSPIQYLKTVRLIEARRLLLFYHITANEAAVKVGYQSTTQFSREYKRFFLNPPHRDVVHTLRYNTPIYQPFSLNHRYDG
ncbi:MAG: AraC family transcriptional regulator [Deltaproteobacteria bacterium]|jgi:AraC-like DNA-binding protein|nr:AraC family transcriptional regulator [Deltaproteobacteria bacterium]